MRKRSYATGMGLLLCLAGAGGALAHGDEKHYSAGAPGDPGKPSRKIEIVMSEGDGSMSFVPNRIEIRKGEQVDFVLKNSGQLAHEFMLATVAENNEHAKLMERFPNMEHDDPNGKRVEPGKSAEILWRFTKPGTFEFACLIPGHRQAGMHGTIIVK